MNSANDAITALQERVKQLELEKQHLKDEIYSLNVSLKAMRAHFDRRQESLITATEKAKSMVNSAISALSELKEERIRNFELKNRTISHEDQESIPNYLQRIERSRKRINCYEKLLSKLFEEPWYYSLDRKKIHVDVDLLPQPTRGIIDRMEKLPSAYNFQNLQTKRAIIQGLICSMELSQTLSDGIYRSDRRKGRTISFEKRGIEAQIFGLTEAINRFTFK